ncbi:MAG: hypothetical protein EPN99_08705 [Frankiales bacterium]|nr:MAG: hypothetical protein EPN99_08705 [Frankiales bacterium]
MTATVPAGPNAPGRATIAARTLRTDRWWLQPVTTVTVLVLFIVYSTFRAFENAHFEAGAYLSPFYSPCIATGCEETAFPVLIPGPAFISPALYILVIPLGFRLTCYYYRKAYYRSFWLSPPACAVAEPHSRYTGETRFPLLFQNLHRYFFYVGLLYPVILLYDAAHTVWARDDGGYVGLGTVILVVNALLLAMYSMSCHSCRHLIGGRLVHFSKHPIRYRLWTWVSRENSRHMKWAWISLVVVAAADFYVRLLSTGAFDDPILF